jgi:hypothetical protein
MMMNRPFVSGAPVVMTAQVVSAMLNASGSFVRQDFAVVPVEGGRVGGGPVQDDEASRHGVAPFQGW